jgi:hypothetical protein
VQPDPAARPEYVAAFGEIARRIAAALAGVSKKMLPVRMIVAGGAALHLYTGARVTRDVDAVFSRRLAVPDDLEVAYRDADGAARVLYLDRQYSDTFALTHENAHDDSVALSVEGVDPRVLDVRLLTPIDLAVSKLSRFSVQDRDDIATLARRGLIDAGALRARALAALGGYVGDTDRVRGSIESACRIATDAARSAAAATAALPGRRSADE